MSTMLAENVVQKMTDNDSALDLTSEKVIGVLLNDPQVTEIEMKREVDEACIVLGLNHVQHQADDLQEKTSQSAMYTGVHLHDKASQKATGLLGNAQISVDTGSPKSRSNEDDENPFNDVANWAISEKPYECGICGYASYSNIDVNTHLKKHTKRQTEGNPFKCDVCEYSCYKKSHLTQHKRVHTGEKPYKCDICGFHCSQKSNLTNHKLIHTGEKPYKCDECDFQSYKKIHLTDHKRIHTGEKPYACDVCGFQCNKKSNLTNHKRVHTGEKPYKCAFCGYACGKNGDLTRHMRVHTGEKPYKCDVCGFQCKRNDGLITHMKRHTRKKNTVVKGQENNTDMIPS